MSTAIKPRFSLSALLVATAVCAIGIVALRIGDWRWARIVFTSFVVLNLSASVCAVYRRGANRAFCIGFAAFGWAYLVFLVTSSFQIAEHLLIGSEIVAVVSDYQPEASRGIVIQTGGSMVSVFSFHQIVHSLVAIGFGFAGGLIGYVSYATRDKSHE